MGTGGGLDLAQGLSFAAPSQYHFNYNYVEKKRVCRNELNSNGFRECINVLRRLLFAMGKTFMCIEYSPCGKQSVRYFMHIIAFNFYSLAF